MGRTQKEDFLYCRNFIESSLVRAVTAIVSVSAIQLWLFKLLLLYGFPPEGSHSVQSTNTHIANRISIVVALADYQLYNIAYLQQGTSRIFQTAPQIRHLLLHAPCSHLSRPIQAAITWQHLQQGTSRIFQTASQIRHLSLHTPSSHLSRQILEGFPDAIQMLQVGQV